MTAQQVQAERIDSPIDNLEVDVYTVPTDRPEADGTLAWDATTMVLVRLRAGSEEGLGFSYCSPAAAEVIRHELAPVIEHARLDSDLPGAMVARVRNAGRRGVASNAIAAVDVAVWDLRARLAGLPLCQLLGARRSEVPIYGSGGFTSYSETELASQLSAWTEEGILCVKMKVGKDWGASPEEDIERVTLARAAIGPRAELFVDANGAYEPKQAIEMGAAFAESGVSYFEEPVSSDHLQQMAFVRQNVSMDVAAGEYGYDSYYFRDMLSAGAVDILQADATRCLGLSGFLQAGTIAHAWAVPFSAHTAPSIHLHAACAVPQISHIEYFHDHVRLEHMLFDGVAEPKGGCLRPDLTRPGLGLELKEAEAEKWRL